MLYNPKDIDLNKVEIKRVNNEIILNVYNDDIQLHVELKLIPYIHMWRCSMNYSTKVIQYWKFDEIPKKWQPTFKKLIEIGKQYIEE